MATLAYLDATAAPDTGEISALLDQGHVGIALYLRNGPASAAALAWPEASWRALDARRAVISLNAVPEATGGIARLLAAHGGCRFLFSHLGLPGRYPAPPSASKAAERLAPLLQLAELPNALVKISGLYAISDPPHSYPHPAALPFIDLMLDRFGPERCLWGSDFSPALDFLAFAQTVSVPGLDRLTQAERGQVMGGNLVRLLGHESSPR
jgi:predicted TIM-barrel fold metal-dependent hydrolase